MAHLGVKRAFPQGSHQQATNKPEGSRQPQGTGKCAKMAHFEKRCPSRSPRSGELGTAEDQAEGGK